MNYKELKNTNVSQKTVLLRADLNVPVSEGKVTDANRINRLSPTIKYLRDNKAKIVILSHFGRPKGEVRSEFSLSFLPPVLAEHWDAPVSFSDDCIGGNAKSLIADMQYGDILLLENTRFYAEEEKNDGVFAEKLASLGDLFIHDAFSVSHRAHSSTEAIAHLLPTAAGFLMAEELNTLHKALENPNRPLAAIVGGAKISTKLELLGNLIEKTDILILGGAMANTFLAAKGFDVKASLHEENMLDEAAAILEKAKTLDCEFVLPIDGLAAEKFERNAPYVDCSFDSIPENHMVLDIGPKSIELIKEKLSHCATLVWNGPLGAFEISPFDKSTNAIAKHVAQLTNEGVLKSVAGGGDTVAALEHAGQKDQMSYVSTAGGAFLEWLEGKTLPGVAALSIYKDAA